MLETLAIILVLPWLLGLASNWRDPDRAINQNLNPLHKMKTRTNSKSAWQGAGLALALAVVPTLVVADETATAAAQARAKAADKTAEKL